MRKLILTRGLPASGKTTWAKLQQEKNPNFVLVNKDELRAMLHSSVHSKGREEFVLATRDFIVEKALSEGHDVIVHDTNFAGKHSLRLGELAKKHNAELVIEDFSGVPLEECIRRDSGRTNAVGASVIKKMWRDYLKPTPPVIKHNPALPDAILCDLDGTLALFGNNNPYDRDFLQDVLNEKVASIIRTHKAFYSESAKELNLIIVSGRDGKFVEQTIQWLKNNEIYYDFMFMRKPEDKRKDSIVKEEIYNKYIKDNFNVLFVLDDRNQVVELWRSLGLTCFQVADGDF